MRTLLFQRFFTIMLIAASASILTSCNKALTKGDIQDDLEDARQATLKAKAKSQEAIESRKQFYTDYKLTRVEALEDRTDQIDKRISDLKKTAKKSSNTAAVGDMESAIRELENEKQQVNRKITEVKALQERDWTQSSVAIDTAVKKIQNELDRLSQSLDAYNEIDD